MLWCLLPFPLDDKPQIPNKGVRWDSLRDDADLPGLMKKHDVERETKR